jgi:hypothetical protein
MAKRIVVALLVLTGCLGAAEPARADATFLIGLHTPSAPSPMFGAAFGRASGLVGWEVEIASSGKQTPTRASAGCFCWNLILQPPLKVGRANVYFVGGAGLYGEVGGGVVATGMSIAVDLGAGLKIPVSGPVNLRLDYRAFLGQAGEADRAIHSHRVAAGLSLAF